MNLPSWVAKSFLSAKTLELHLTGTIAGIFFLSLLGRL